MGKRQKARKERRNLLASTTLENMGYKLKRGPQFDARGLMNQVDVPSDEKVLIKTVPAHVDMEDGSPKVVVGEALLYDDGSVDIMISPDADPAAVERIKGVEKQFGYSIETED